MANSLVASFEDWGLEYHKVHYTLTWFEANGSRISRRRAIFSHEKARLQDRS